MTLCACQLNNNAIISPVERHTTFQLFNATFCFSFFIYASSMRLQCQSGWRMAIAYLVQFCLLARSNFEFQINFHVLKLNCFALSKHHFFAFSKWISNQRKQKENLSCLKTTFSDWCKVLYKVSFVQIFLILIVFLLILC